MKRIILGSVCLSIAALASCGDSAPKDDAAPAAGIVSAEGDFATNLQTALIEAVSGSTVELPVGHFQLETGLSLDVNGITLIGAGSDKTILDFSGQTGAGEGLLVTSDDVTLAEFSIRDTKGDGIKSKGADRITYRLAIPMKAMAHTAYTRSNHETCSSSALSYAVHPMRVSMSASPKTSSFAIRSPSTMLPASR